MHWKRKPSKQNKKLNFHKSPFGHVSLLDAYFSLWYYQINPLKSSGEFFLIMTRQDGGWDAGVTAKKSYSPLTEDNHLKTSTVPQRKECNMENSP